MARHTASRLRAFPHFADRENYTNRCRRSRQIRYSSSLPLFVSCSILERVNTRQIAPLLVKVQAETEHVSVGHADADEIRAQVGGRAAMPLLAQRGDQYARCAFIDTKVTNRLER